MTLLAVLYLSKAKAQQPLLELINAEQAGITFKNTIQENGKYNRLIGDYVYNGAGVAIGDINNDGLPDIYFTGNQIPDRLYLNQGNFKFKELTNFGFRISERVRPKSETRNPSHVVFGGHNGRCKR